MTIAQCIVTYAVCWWLVLFMVLPHEAAAPDQPGPGHAPSAPANPQLKRKCRWATLWAILPTIAIYFIATYAHAEDAIYHAGSGCAAIESYKNSGDVSTKDGEGAHGKKVAAADLTPSHTLGNMDNIKIPLEIPTSKYADPTAHNVDLSESWADMGTIEVSKDGGATLNGDSINQQVTVPAECDHATQ